MMSQQITTRHLHRLACLYVLQSTLKHNPARQNFRYVYGLLS
jgi:hypothetical protein